MNVSVNELILLHNGRPLTPTATLAAAGVADNDVLIMRGRQRRPQQSQTQQQQQQQQPQSQQQQQQRGADLASILSSALQQAQAQQRSATDPQAYRQQMLSDPHAMALLSERQPTLANAIRSGDLATIQRILVEHRNAQAAREREMAQLQADPFNVENQRRIEQLIREEQIHENYENAVEHNPAAFGRVVMLYINCKVNNVPVKAFVDSGAQMTIMSPRMAKSVNIFHLIDHRFAGVAVGVGSQRIIGRVHMAPITIGGQSYPCTVTVLERDDMDFLLGLDMLKAHRAIIDLNENVLRIGAVATPFLGEADIPRNSLGNLPPTPADVDDDGQTATTSATTGGGEPPEAMIATLVGLGASREQAIHMLRATNNDVDAAAGLLFG